MVIGVKLKELTQYQFGYLAAMIDGEGCIGLGRQKKLLQHNYTYASYVAVNNSYKPVLDWCQNVTNIGTVGPARIDKRLNRKPMYRWWLNCEEVKQLLPAILPYLIIKTAQAELVIEFYTKCYDCSTEQLKYQSEILREVIFNELADLNKRGI